MEETKDNAATAKQGAAQPDTGTTPAKSAAETKLEGQLAAAVKKGEGYKKERDTARTDLSAALGTITSQNEEITRLSTELAKHPIGTVLSTDAEAPAEPSEEDTIKDVLKRNNLKVAYMLPSGPCFSEAHAREYAGADFDSLTVISVEKDARTN